MHHKALRNTGIPLLSFDVHPQHLRLAAQRDETPVGVSALSGISSHQTSMGTHVRRSHRCLLPPSGPSGCSKGREAPGTKSQIVLCAPHDAENVKPALFASASKSTQG